MTFNKRSGGPVRAQFTSGDAGSMVRARRKEVGLTQQQLAEGAEVSRQTVISLETGDYAPSVYLALRVAQLLDTTVEALWGTPSAVSAMADATLPDTTNVG
jgi:putative transcriptional regulator